MERSPMVTLRQEHSAGDSSRLIAYLDDEGDLHLDAHYLGPATAAFGASEEYEHNRTIRAADFGALRALLGSAADGDLLAILGRDWSGPRSYELERLLAGGSVPVASFTWRS